MSRPQDAPLPPQDVPSYTRFRAPVQGAAVAVGALFLGVGVLGFVPGVTTDYAAMDFAGHSAAMLFGVFAVSVLHNLVHLAFGIAGLALSRTSRTARGFLLGGGLIYLVLFLYGLLVGESSPANFVPVNAADNWLHLGLAAVMIGLGVLLGGRTARR
ncbi:DUF4383 domain-containing protein [Amycolatopsis anabasis]|uniref:DUF4383 domain-containing protein n=1 Tax=Amycolatopsis anabasis TaxID=1840409 RepID=UPI00131CE413|nr:DUF4383 domain-containing protein [Amycolatopsis anabasis]